MPTNPDDTSNDDAIAAAALPGVLRSLGLERLVTAVDEHEIDLESARMLSAGDAVELGLEEADAASLISAAKRHVGVVLWTKQGIDNQYCRRGLNQSGPRRRRGCDVDIPWRWGRGAAAAATRIFRGDRRRLRYGFVRPLGATTREENVHIEGRMLRERGVAKGAAVSYFRRADILQTRSRRRRGRDADIL